MANVLERVLYRGLRPLHGRECPLCGWHGFKFLPIGVGHWRRDDGMCPFCMSRERHRLAYVVMKPVLAAGGWKTLHVAPEQSIQKWLRSVSADYLSIDLERPDVMRRMDLTDLQLPDASRTLVWCSHVLEHVPADAKALREIHRVLAPGGLALLQVPIEGEKTYEDPKITTPEARLKAFHQEDHVRQYGIDFIDRVRAAGFEVEVRRTADLPEALVRRHSLSYSMSNEVFIARKSAAS